MELTNQELSKGFNSASTETVDETFLKLINQNHISVERAISIYLEFVEIEYTLRATAYILSIHVPLCDRVFETHHHNSTPQEKAKKKFKTAFVLSALPELKLIVDHKNGYLKPNQVLWAFEPRFYGLIRYCYIGTIGGLLNWEQWKGQHLLLDISRGMQPVKMTTEEIAKRTHPTEFAARAEMIGVMNELQDEQKKLHYQTKATKEDYKSVKFERR